VIIDIRQDFSIGPEDIYDTIISSEIYIAFHGRNAANTPSTTGLWQVLKNVAAKYGYSIF
jgi:hypothetical protein